MRPNKRKLHELLYTEIAIPGTIRLASGERRSKEILKKEKSNKIFFSFVGPRKFWIFTLLEKSPVRAGSFPNVDHTVPLPPSPSPRGPCSAQSPRSGEQCNVGRPPDLGRPHFAVSGCFPSRGRCWHAWAQSWGSLVSVVLAWDQLSKFQTKPWFITSVTLYPESHEVWSVHASMELRSKLQVCVMLSTQCLSGNK